MTDLLDKVDDALEQVEEQLLAEFNRIRESDTGKPFGEVDPGIKTALGSVLTDLHHMLEHSGDENDLQLLTDRHEQLFSRLRVSRELLQRKIPTSMIRQAHTGVQKSRRVLETKVLERRKNKTTVTSNEKTGLFGSLKGLFGSKPSAESLSRNQAQITADEEAQLSSVQVYLDNGIYSASRELAMLSSLVAESAPGSTEDVAGPTDGLEKQQITGKASFQSRELSQTINPGKPKEKIAQSPDEIRRKLAQRNQTGSGASQFYAKDLTGQSASERAQVAANAPGEQGKVAQSPEEIRRKLAERSPNATQGASSFRARDVNTDPTLTQAPPKKAQTPEEIRRKLASRKQSDTKSGGKAVFQSRDLKDDPDRHR